MRWTRLADDDDKWSHVLTVLTVDAYSDLTKRRQDSHDATLRVPST